ncbi:hypothetical protein AB1L42_03915 [Thalassoglobus sp. JC818]|uniref:hypothetical protein n=1 Tax=Thalassoglobus sp. JC818 TaxID=3232136 RepID=UPI003458CB22
MTSPEEFPPTIIVVHPKEKRSKCSVEPLRGTPGFEFWKFPVDRTEPMTGYYRLGIGGPQLTPEDRNSGLLVLDATWKLAGPMEEAFDDVPIRSLNSWKTAYPRKSKLFEDPAEGLATIEAVFAAYSQLGRPTDGLLDSYYWGEKFLEINSDLL